MHCEHLLPLTNAFSDERAEAKGSEAEVGQLVDKLNQRIRTAIRTGISGPPFTLMPLNPDTGCRNLVPSPFPKLNHRQTREFSRR